jgi:molecular chaperone GrpE
MAADPKGPKLDIPDELAEALEAADQAVARADAEGPGAGEWEADLADADASGASELAEAKQQAEQLRGELAALQDRLLRMAAEHENQRRRWSRDQQDALLFANDNLIKDLLPTVDNLERALEHARQSNGEESDKKNLLEGVELTFRSLMGVLERAGVEVVGASGVEFDPRFHEAMRQIPSAEHPPNTVLDVYQKGFVLRGRLIRPALVAVSGPTPPAGS